MAQARGGVQHEGVKGGVVPARRFTGGQPHAVARRRADEPGAPDEHVPDGRAHGLKGFQTGRGETVRQQMLINDRQGARFVNPDGPVRLAVDIHEEASAAQLDVVSYKRKA